MPDESEDLRSAREAARLAREEAEKLRQQARELEHRLRDEERRNRQALREERRQEAQARRHAFGPPHPPRTPFEHGGAPAGGDGVREEHVLDFTGVTHLSVDQTAGKVHVRPLAPGEAPAVIVSANKTPPKIDIVRSGDHVTVNVKLQTGWLFRRRQGASLELRIPQDLVELRVHLGAGEIDIRDVAAAALVCDTGAGEIKTMAVRGDLRANTGAGRIVIQSHRGLCRCDTGTGDVVIDVAELMPGEYRGNVGMGRIEVRLPAGHEVHIRASSGIGKSKIEYPAASDSAPTSVRIETGIGEASVRARKVEPPPPPAGSVRPQREARADTARRRREAEELRVLQMLEQGRISSQEAAELIAALQGATMRFDGTDAEFDSDDERPEERRES